MKILVLLMCTLASFSLFAQMPGGMPNRGGQQMSGRFYGRIVDAANKGIEAASVTLVTDKMDTATRHKKEVIVGGMLTSANGDFSIENVPVMAQYRIKITGIGYKNIENKVSFEMPKGATGNPSAMLGALDKDLGNLKLEIDDKLLQGVTVTATKPLLQMGIDRKIFNVDKNIVSQGGTAIDVMKNVPSVSVDIDGNVTLRNSAPTIFVDGRPTNLTLEQIPSDAIESVEIITNPSAKFDASGGTAGILNIVLKKNKRVGYSGNIRANVDSRGKVGGGGDVNVRQNKVNFFANAMVSQRKSISTGSTIRQTYDSLRTRSSQMDKNTMNGLFGFGRGGFDFFINNRNTITLSGSLVRGKMSPSSVSDIYINEKNSDVGYNPRFSNSTYKFKNTGSQVSFKHNFPKAGNDLTADVTYNKGTNENNSVIRTENYVMPSRQFKGIYNQFQNSMSNNENFIFQSDYANPINDKSKFELGARVSIRKINSLTDYVISSKTSSTAYTNEDRVYAGYGTYTSKIKDFGYQLGLRAESSMNEGVLNAKQSYKSNFPISLFPSVFLSQKLDDTQDLQFNYSRRINRPNFFQLFPFTDYSDSFNISRGNPNLKPEFTNSLELSYSKLFKNRDNFIASIYFKNTNNLITSFLRSENDTFLKRNVLVSSYINANRSYVTGLELTSRNKLAKWWDLTSNVNLFSSKIDLNNQPDPAQFFSYFVKINNSFKLPKNFTVQLSGDYQSKRTTSPGGRGSGGGGGMYGGGMYGGGSGSSAQGFIRPNYGVDAAVKYEFLKDKRASLSMSMNDIFKTKKYDSHIEQSGFFVQDSWRRRDAQMLRLNFNYRFGKFDASLFKRKNTRTEDAGMEGVNFKP